MSRRKRIEEPENHDRWLVSYADFITLLFAFFVVMYSISSVNEGKFRVLSDSMNSAFRDPMRSLDPVQVGTLLRSPVPQDQRQRTVPSIELFPVPRHSPLPEQIKNMEGTETAVPDESTDAQELDKAAEMLADSIENNMKDLVDQGLINVRRDKRWIEVEIKSSILFPSASSTLSSQSTPVLKKLANKLKTLDNIIHVEGFTDNVPISNFEFRSNWELSAARAASVVHLFTELGLNPERMAAIGYGEYRPIADNNSARGRADNRRVVLVIMSGSDARVQDRADHLQSFREGTRDRAQNTQPVEEALSVETAPETSASRQPAP